MTRTLLACATLASTLLPGAALAQGQAAQSAQPTQAISKADFTKNVDTRFAAIDSNRDGALSKQEIAAMQSKALADAAAAEQKQVEADFKKLDTNNDGSLSLAEFKAAAPAIRVRQTADQMLAELDSNKDGKVTAAEYRAGPLANFDKADANHDGTLTAQELASARRR